MLNRDGFHSVVADSLPDDTKRILPLIGNDDLKLCVDARGVMHDQKHAWPSHPPARITWTGRRYDRRLDEYNSNLFEWGWVDLQRVDEDPLPAVTGWRQTLHPRQGHVETVIQRGDIEECTISFVHLEHNLIVFHRQYRNAPQGGRIRATYTLCQNDVTQLPYRLNWTPAKPDAQGVEADTLLDGLRLHKGRLAFFTDAGGTVSIEGNRITIDAPLPASGAITVYLAMEDDLSELEPFQRIDYDGWMSEPVRQVHHENLARRKQAVRPDPVAAIAATRRLVKEEGFASLFASHRAGWEKWFSQVKVEFPPQEELLRAALDTQLYTIRCSYTDWSIPANPFNTSWGACYFWDERFPTEGLMQLGVWDMPRRVAEFRRTNLPLATMGSGGRGARYMSSVSEAGTTMNDRTHTSIYEFFPIAVFVNCIYSYCRYHDDEATWRRYYPIFREAAEFHRHYLLAELPGNNVMAIALIDVDETVHPVQDGPFIVPGAARVFQVAIETAQRLGIYDEELPQWERMGAMTLHLARHLDELAQANTKRRDGAAANNPSGAFCDFELATLPPPAIEVDPIVQRWRDEQRRLVRDAVVHKHKESAEYQKAFWSWGSLSEAYRTATSCRPDDAMHHFRKSLTTIMDFGSLNESARVDLSHVNHPWFTTGAGAYARTLTRMLLHPDGNKTYICPGIPTQWRDFGFTLPIHSQGELTLKVADGQIVELTLHQRKPTRRVFYLPKRFTTADRLHANARIVAQDGDYITVQTEAAEVCRLITPAAPTLR